MPRSVGPLRSEALPWTGREGEEVKIGLKIKNNSKSLNDFVANQRGAMLQKSVGTSGDYLVLGGKQIQRYYISDDAKGKIKANLVDDQKAYVQKDSILVQNIVAHVVNPTPHIVIIGTVPDKKSIDNCVILDTVNQLSNTSNLSNRFILGVLCSNLVSWYAYRFVFANAIRTMHFDKPTTEKIPFPDLNLKNKQDKLVHDQIVNHVEYLLTWKKDYEAATSVRERDKLDKKRRDTEGSINALVYGLYDLTASEIALIEGV